MAARQVVKILLAMGLLLAAGSAFATPGQERRVALVIGNGAYLHGTKLRNTVNDARAVAERLASIGFDLGGGPLLDAGKPNLETALRAFRARSQNATVAFFFYAGHGIQAEGRNRLVPVDAELKDPADLELETVDVDAVLGQMRAEINLIVLDACRDNPFESQLQSAAAGLGRAWSGGRGFARIDPGTMRGGSMLAMAAAPGAIAADGSGTNSPYTTALLRHLTTPGLEARFLFAKVREEVEAATGSAQRPEAVDRLPAREVFLVPLAGTAAAAAAVPPAAAPASAPASTAPAAPAPPTVLTPDRTAIELAFWNTIATSRNPADFKAYLKRYPEGQFIDLARNRVEDLTRSDPPQVPASTAPVAAPAPVSAPPRPPLPNKPPAQRSSETKVSSAVDTDDQPAVNRPKPEPAIWEGAGQEFADGAKWTIRISLVPGSTRQTIEYPSLNCSGILTALAIDTKTSRYRETITKGKDRCADGGMVILTPSRGELLYQWLDKDGELGAKGTLELAEK